MDEQRDGEMDKWMTGWTNGVKKDIHHTDEQVRRQTNLNLNKFRAQFDIKLDHTIRLEEEKHTQTDG